MEAYKQPTENNKKQENLDLEKPKVIDFKAVVAWIFRLDNIRIAIAIAGIIMSMTFNWISYTNRKSKELSSAYSKIGELRDFHQKEVSELKFSHMRECQNLKLEIVELKNEVKVLKSESKTFQDRLEGCRDDKP